MFMASYKLAVNPFASDQPRPLFESSAVSELLVKLNGLVKGRHHCVLISGPAGVGKSRLITEWVKKRTTGFTVVWAGGPGLDDTSFLKQLLKDLGLSAIHGSLTELRNIVEVFLRHQAGQGRRTIIIGDALETMPAPVVAEFEWLSRLRLKGVPVVHLVLATRDAGLVQGLIPEESGHSTRRWHVYHPLGGFTLEETWNYVSSCLRSVGCHGVTDLFPDASLREVHGYSAGIVGDTNAICAEALEIVARQSVDRPERPTVTRAILKQAAQRANLAFKPGALEQLEAPLSADAVQQSDPGELTLESARLMVASGGRVVAEVNLNRPRMVLGRDHACDISLESRYISRYQNLFMETALGWWLLDLNSTNGSYVNGRRVREHHLQDGDVISVGHHQLRFVGTAPALPADSGSTTVVQSPWSEQSVENPERAQSRQ